MGLYGNVFFRSFAAADLGCGHFLFFVLLLGLPTEMGTTHFALVLDHEGVDLGSPKESLAENSPKYVQSTQLNMSYLQLIDILTAFSQVMLIGLAGCGKTQSCTGLLKKLNHEAVPRAASDDQLGGKGTTERRWSPLSAGLLGLPVFSSISIWPRRSMSPWAMYGMPTLGVVFIVQCDIPYMECLG